MDFKEIKIRPLINPMRDRGSTSKTPVKPGGKKHRRQKKGRENMPKEQTVVMVAVEAPSMAKAIRAKCLDCCGGEQGEVRTCWAENCPLFPYRFGSNPKAAIKRLEKSYTVEVK